MPIEGGATPTPEATPEATPEVTPVDEEVVVEEKQPASKATVDAEVAKLDRMDYERPELSAFKSQVEEQYRDRTPEEEAAKVEAAKAEALRNAVISKAAGDAKYRSGDYASASGYYAEEAAFLEKSK